jgi:hypothetical protein
LQLKHYDGVLKKLLGKEKFTFQELEACTPIDSEQKLIKSRVLDEFKRYSINTNDQLMERYNEEAFI